MNAFWQLAVPAGAVAVIEAGTGRAVTYAELTAAADATAAALALPAGKALVGLFCRNDLASLTAYLGALRAGHAVCLLPAGAAPPAAPLLEIYAPERLLAPANLGPWPGYRAGAPAGALACWHRCEPAAAPAIHPDLALLLSTSGTTGSPKLVRLSRANLQANAGAIRDYLGLTAADRAPTTLPLSYSYGLSVVHSHLAAGATLVLGEFPPVQQATWTSFARHAVTSFAGVPLLYELLRRLRFDPRSQPTLRTYTQAGGRLGTDTKRWFLAAADAAGARFFVMYGQTEATARISFVPPDRLAGHSDSIGRAIPGGELSIDPANREILYRGPNVMLGYALSRADLAAGDTTGGLLRTGDLGRADADGFFYIEGRLRRFLKLAGLRVSLDELERRLEAHLGAPVACAGADEALLVHTEAVVPAAQVLALLQAGFGLAPALATVRTGQPLARLHSGKIDYAALAHA